jgi:copper(I)-binding protein
MIRPVLFAALLFGLAGCNPGSHSTVTATDPVVRLSPVAGQPAAGYLRVSASADHQALTGVSSSQAARIEMHETMSSGTMTMMRPLARIDLVSNSEIVFAPGGRHLMIFGLDPKLKPGDSAQLVIHFAHGAPVTVAARLIAAGDDAAH